jgi:hypothetical protein
MVRYDDQESIKGKLWRTTRNVSVSHWNFPTNAKATRKWTGIPSQYQRSDADSPRHLHLPSGSRPMHSTVPGLPSSYFPSHGGKPNPYHRYEGRLPNVLETQPRVYFLILLHPTLWPLEGKRCQWLSLWGTRHVYWNCHLYWTLSNPLAEGPISDAREASRRSLTPEASSYCINGGGF